MSTAGERLSLELLTQRFADHPPVLGADEVLIEASRCLFCFDAPCTRACPTHIDVPKFIRQILHDNDLGAARTILDANIFGGSCARACPTEVLCEGACVDNTLLQSPVQIGRLQRHATDTATRRGARFFVPGKPTGRKVAIVGAGPAGLTCAHELRKKGHDVVVFEARDVAGGLNTLGIAAYKITTEFALTEVELVRQIGVDIRLNHRITADALKKLLAEFDAVFLGVGLGQTQSLGLPGEQLPNVWEALDFIFQTHTKPFTECEVGRRVVVIGAGNTAIDVATAAKRLGADEVIVAYRRGPDAMSAFAYEYELAKADGIRFEFFVQPVEFLADGVRFARHRPVARGEALAVVPGSEFVLPADMAVKALGQQPLLELLKSFPGLKLAGGAIAVDPETRATSVSRLYAGGDCLRAGGEIVDAVQDGKVAAAGIHRILG